MNVLRAPIIEVAPLEPAAPGFLRTQFDGLEQFLERERAQLPLWFVAAIGAGIAGWFAMPGMASWIGLLCVGAALALAGLLLPGSWSGRSLVGLGLGLIIGCGLIWWRAERVAAPRLVRPMVTVVEGTVLKVEPMIAKDDVRVTVESATAGLPPRVRFSLPAEQRPPGLAKGAVVKARVRLAPPPAMALPGTHDFARDAWFKGLGGVGRAIGKVEVVTLRAPYGVERVRASLDEHIRKQLQGPSGAIATALVTGDQHALSDEDAEAMRRSGLTHLLSVSGLHIAAVVGAAMLIALKLLALSERLALRVNLVLAAAGVGALAGVAYTVLTGMQVPTVRSCIAALLVLGGIALGRDALSLRLVAVGALVVMLLWPESVAGPSFQLSFAAVTAIIAFQSLSWTRRTLGPTDGGWPIRVGRGLLSLLVTGLVVEIALMPFALYHFHKAGLYGVAANIVAIPWTTFVIMPLEALALLLDALGAGALAWAAAGWAIDQLLGLARWVGGMEGAVASMPSMPRGAFALMVTGGLWLCLWCGQARLAGLAPIALGALGAMATPSPDLLVTGDGRHLAIVEDGRPVLLRERSGDFIRSLLSEAAGYDGETLDLAGQRYARCSRDSCVARIDRKGRTWILLAIKSRHRIRWEELTDACTQADIVVAERWLPRACTPRWLKLDRPMLERTGGVSIRLGKTASVVSVAQRVGDHPWASSPSSLQTASSLPDGSMKWNRRPPGKEKIGRAITPPAATTASNAGSSRSTRITGSGADKASSGWPLSPTSVGPPVVAE